jgi:Rod binding domain-containing protein
MAGLMDATASLGLAQDAYSLGLQRQVATAARAQAQPQGYGAVGAVNEKSAKDAAESFESFFVGQMLEYMWEGVEVDPMFGGGHAEEMWRSMLNQEYGKHVVKSGGLGIANQVMTSMLRAQEERTLAEQQLAAQGAATEGDTGTAGAVAAAAQVRR